MAELETTRVPVFVHDTIDEEPIDASGVPLALNAETDGIPVVTKHVGGAANGILSSPSEQHGRSYVLNLSELTQGGQDPLVWHDRYGNPYTTLSTKGNNFSEARLIPSGTAPSGFIPYGLQEGDALLRVVRASRLMRKLGIETEWPVLIAEPKQLIYKEEILDQHTYKQRLIGDLVATQQETEESNPGEEPLTTQEISERAVAINAMDFFVTVRATATMDRLLDIIHEPKYIDRVKLNAAIDNFNLLATERPGLLERLKLPDHLEPVDPEGGPIAESASQYFCEVIAKSVGHYLGLMHRAGLRHSFPHIGNVTSLGGLVDLDSVRGEPLDLNDYPTTPSHMARDLTYVMHGFAEHFVFASVEELSSYLGTTKQFNRNLIDQYLDTRGLTMDELTKDHQNLELMVVVNQSYENDEKTRTRRGGIIDRLFPETPQKVRQKIEGFFAGAGEQYTHISPRDVARYLYWSYFDNNMLEVWDYATGRDSDMWELFDADRIPDDSAIEEGFRVAVEDILSNDAFNERTEGRRIPFHIYQMADKRKHSMPGFLRRRLTKAAKELTSEMYEPGSNNYALALTMMEQKLETAVIQQLVPYIPQDSAVVDEALQIFRSRYLAKQEHRSLPKQPVIDASIEDLRHYSMLWEFSSRQGLLRYYSEVPHRIVEEHLSSEVTPQVVATPDQALRTVFDPDESICLVLTDGLIQGTEEKTHDESGNELEKSYLQYGPHKPQPNNATYAFFLIREKEGTYRGEYNVVSASAAKVSPATIIE